MEELLHLQILFHFLGQGRDHVEEIANHTIVGLLKYGGIRILVDRNNHL